MLRNSWRRWKNRRGTRRGGVRRAPGDRRLRFESLETRWLLAAFSDTAPSLNLVLGTNQQATILSTGSTYQLTLNTGAWSGPTGDANVTGNGSSTLTVTSAGISAFATGINITDTGSTGGDGVTFSNSLSSGYANNFVITLANSTSSVAFTGASSLTGSSSLTATASGAILINSGASITTAGGAISLVATGVEAPLTASGNVLSNGGAITLQATGAVTVNTGVTINSGSGILTLAADVNSSDQGDDGVGTLSINAGATVTSSNASTNAITLRGADVNIDTSNNPAVVGAARQLATTPSATLVGLSSPMALAFDSSGNLYAANFGIFDGGAAGTSVSEFAPGSTTASATLTGLSTPSALTFDSSGSLYVANYGNFSGTTVSKFALGSTAVSATLMGLSAPGAMAFDSSGNLYVVNHNNSTVSKFAPGSTTASATLTGLSNPGALALDSSGNLYVANEGNNTVSKFAPGSTTASVTYSAGLSYPTPLAFDSSGDLYVANRNNNTVSEFAPGSTTASVTYSAGVSAPYALAFDSGGNLYVANFGSNTVSKFTPGSTAPSATLTGINGPDALTFGSSGDLYVANQDGTTVSEFAPSGTTPSAGGVMIQSSVESRPMLIGGTNSSSVAGINLTTAELAQIFTTSTGTVTIGDTAQTGIISFSTATPATTAGAALNVIQSTTGAGEIILDNGAGFATALNGNGGNISLTSGTGGIQEASTNLPGTADLATTGASVTLLTEGPIGADGYPIQFADDANTLQQQVIIGSPAVQPGDALLDGLGNLTLGNVIGPDGYLQVDVTARQGLTVTANSTINVGGGYISLAADVNADSTADGNTAKLSIQSGAVLESVNSSPNAITLRGADVDIDTSSNPAVIGAMPGTAYNANLNSPEALAFDSSGNLYVANAGSGTVSKFAPGSTTPSQVLSGLNDPGALAFDPSGNLYVSNDLGLTEFAPGSTTPIATYPGGGGAEALAFDSSGDLYVLDRNQSTVLEFTPGSLTPSAELAGLSYPYALVIDSHGDLYVSNGNGDTISEFAPGSTVPTTVYSGVLDPYLLAVDSSGNLYVAGSYEDAPVSKFAAGSTTPTATLSISGTPYALAVDASGNLYVLNGTQNTVSRFANGSLVATAVLIGLNDPGAMAFDSSGNLYVTNAGNSSVSKFAPGSTTATVTYPAGLANPSALAFNSSGTLLVANAGNNTVSEFVAGSATASTSLSGGLNNPVALVLDLSGTLYVANDVSTGTVSEFAAGSTTVARTLTGLSGPDALALDSSGNLYVAANTGNKVYRYAPGGVGPNATYSAGISAPTALAVDSSGNLYVANSGNNTVTEFAAGSTTLLATFVGLSGPAALALDPSGNLYVANEVNGTVSTFAPGSATAIATLSGLYDPDALRFDSSGDLYVVDYDGTVVKFAPGSTTASVTYWTGPNAESDALAFDLSGNLYVANGRLDSVTKFGPGNFTAVAGGVIIESADESRPVQVGGTNNSAVQGVNLTSAELARIFTTVDGTLTIGDGNQTGNIIFSTATPTTTAGATLDVIQSTAGAGQTILDDGAGTGTALNGNGGSITLTAGSGGIQALAANDSAPAIATTGPTVTLLTSGPIGTGSHRIQFADDANTAQQNVLIGSTTVQPSSVYLDGLGSLTLGSVLGSVSNPTIDVTARTNLVVAAGSTINSGTGKLSLGADLNADETGNDGVGTLSVSAAALVASSNTSSNAMTLRGANVAISSTALVENRPQLGPNPVAISPNMFDPNAIAVDSHGDVFVANGGFFTLGTTVTEYAPGSTTVAATLTGLSGPNALAVDSSGNVYVSNLRNDTVSMFAPDSTTATLTYSVGVSSPDALAIDTSGDLYVANEVSDTVVEFALGSTVPKATLTGVTNPNSLVFDSSGNLYVANGGTTVSEFAPGSATPTTTYSGLANPFDVAVGPNGYLYVMYSYFVNPTLVEFAPGATVPTATLTGLTTPRDMAFDSSGNLYVTDAGKNDVSEFAPGATTASATFTGLNSPFVLTINSNNQMFVTNDGNVSEFTLGNTTPTATVYGNVSTPIAFAFDSAGNLYVANVGNNTVSKFAPGNTGPNANATYTAGISEPNGLAFDSSGNLYVANAGANTVTEFAPGSTTPTTAFTGLNSPTAVAAGQNGYLYVYNVGDESVSEFAPGSTTPTTTITSSSDSSASIAIDPHGDLFIISDVYGSTVSEFAPGSTTAAATLTGLDDPEALAFDSHGNLYVANHGNGTVSEFAPGSATANATFTGLDEPVALVVDSAGNLYVLEGSNTLVEFSSGSETVLATYSNVSTLPAKIAVDPYGDVALASELGDSLYEFPPTGSSNSGGGIVIQSSVESRPMQIGTTTNTPASGIYLTNAELARISTTATGTITFGDTTQTGNITFSTATPATTPSAALNVLQATSGPGQIILDDASGTGTGLNGNGGKVTLTPGTGGIQTTLYATGTPLATNGFTARGTSLNLALGSAPNVGTQLTVVDNTATPAASNPISGTFSNLPQGGAYTISYLGTPYYFQANYQGGDGNDLVLTDVGESATQLVATSQPPSTVMAGGTFNLTITAEDANDNAAMSFTGSVTIALANNPGSSTLGGTLTVSAVGGMAVFSGLTLNRVGSGYTLAVTSGTLTSATSNPISVTPGAATQLLVTTQPPSAVTVGSGFEFTVTAEDAEGNVATSFSGSETVALAANPGRSTLGGTLTVSATSGVAAFSGLTLNNIAGGYTLQATSGVLAAATSSSINVVPKLVVTTQPPSTVTAGRPFTWTVAAEDGNGNLVTTFTGMETVALAYNAGGSTLSGTLAITASGGVATFSDVLNMVGTGYTLAVSNGSPTPALTHGFNVASSAATQLVVTGQPLSSVTAGSPFATTVAVEDSQGNVVTAYSGTVAMAIGNNPGAGSLGGTTSVSVSGGVAAFSNLSLNMAGSGYTLVATSPGLSAVATGSFNVVSSATATQLVILGKPPASVAAGSGFGFTVAAEDAQGNVVSGYSGSAIVSLANNPGSSTLTGTTSVSFASGLAVFSNLALNKTGTGYTLLATSGTLTSAASSTISVIPGAATQLTVIGQPPATVTAGSSFSYTIAAEDAQGNVVTGYGGSVAVALVSNPGGSSLSGTLSVVASAGMAKFSDVLNMAGVNYILKATSGALTTNTGGFNVMAGAATKLIITGQPPTSVTAGGSFGVTATVEDAQGNVASGYTGTISVALRSNPGNSVLSGTLVLPAAGGVATFSNLMLNKAGTGYSLLVSPSGLPAVTSSNFNIVAGAASQLIVSTLPPASVTAGSPFGLAITAEDSQGNRVSSFTGSVSLALASNPGSSTLGGTLAVNASGGVATFSGLSLNKADGGYTLEAASSGLSPATTTGFSVVAGAATQLAITTPPPTTVTAGVVFGYTVTAEDAEGNVATGFNGTLSVAILANPGGSTLSGALSVAARSGVAKLSSVLNQPDSGYTLQLSSSGLTAATTGSITVISAAHQDPAGGPAPSGSPAVPALVMSQLAPIVSEAIGLWSAAGITTAQVAALKSAQITITNTSDQGALALTAGASVMIDPTADGYGWDVDPALGEPPAAGRMDLLTVVEHELGHVLGLPDVSASLLPNDLMDTTLATGVRRLPSAEDIDALLTGQWIASSAPPAAAPAGVAWFWGPASIVSSPAAAVAMLAAASSGSANLPSILSLPLQQGPPNPAMNLRRSDSSKAGDSAEDSAAHDSFFSALG